MILVNPTGSSKTVTIEGNYRRFTGSQAPLFNNGLPIQTIQLASKDGIVLTGKSGSRDF